jgi:hypothetical protein
MSPAVKRFLTILFGSTGLACSLGICLDLVTANIAVEYFSVHHPTIVPTANPWILAIVWGVAASWWFGAIAGLVIASINHWRQTPLEPRRILKWNLIACILIWVTLVTVVLSVIAIAELIPPDKRRATFEHDRRLVAVAMAHQYEYLLGAIALVVIAIMTWRSRPSAGK